MVAVSALLWILVLESMLFGSVQVDYVIDVRHPEKRSLEVVAEIEGLSNNQTFVTLPTRFGTALESSRLSNLSFIKDDEVPVPAIVEGTRVSLVREAGSRVVLSFQLASSSFLQVDKSTWVDPHRAIIQPQDILLQFETPTVRSRFVFKLPPKWRVMDAAKRDRNEIFEPKSSVPIFLCEGDVEQKLIKGCDVVWIVEPMSLQPEEVLNLKKAIMRQIGYYQAISQRNKKAPLLIAVLSSEQPLREASWTKEEPNLVSSPYLVAVETSRSSLSLDDEKRLVQYLSLGLVRSYFSVLRTFSENLNTVHLLEYLSLKAKLKIGGLTVNEFLELMARSLDDRNAMSSEKDDQQTAVGGIRGDPVHDMADYFLLDLALAFYGESSDSLEAFLLSNFRESSRSLISRVEFRRKAAQELRPAKLLGRFQSDETNDDLLKPFGLLLERRLSAQLPFELTETFQISRVHNDVNSALLPGDRILAINRYKLLSPADLVKCRVLLGSLDEVELSVQRNGGVLRLQQRVGRQRLLRLEVNQLADADKREKLEKFLSHSAADQ